MTTKKKNSRYPNCSALGILFYPKGEPRVQYRDLKEALRPSELEAFDKWFGQGTQDSLGIYAWDVEDFLSGRPNTD